MYASSILTCAKRNDPWQTLSSSNLRDDQKRFGPEPHFMREIIEWQIPIAIGGVTYTPLCQEFPASPGIDLVYLGSDSSILLAEVKRENTFDPIKLRRESLHHIFKYIQQDVTGMIQYCRDRPEEAVLDALPVLIQWLDRNLLEAKSKIYDLVQKNLVLAAGIVGGMLTPGLRHTVSANYIVVGITPLATDHGLCVRSETVKGEGVPNFNSLIDELKLAYDQYEQTDKSSKPRKTVTRSIPYGYFAGLSEGTPTRFFFELAIKLDLRLTPGTGTEAARSMNAQCADANGRPRTVFSIKRINEVNIPAGNMRGQAAYLRVTQDDISSLVRDIAEILPSAAIEISDKDYIQIDFSRVPCTNRERGMHAVAHRLCTFLLLSRRNIGG